MSTRVCVGERERKREREKQKNNYGKKCIKIKKIGLLKSIKDREKRVT